jgi:hypothetical protein
VPLPQPAHTGSVPKGGGVHNYPTPVTDTAFFNDEGHEAAVVPTHPLGSGRTDLHVIHSEPGSKLNRMHKAAEARGQGFILQDGDALHAHLARQAFGAAAAAAPRPPGNAKSGTTAASDAASRAGIAAIDTAKRAGNVADRAVGRTAGLRVGHCVTHICVRVRWRENTWAGSQDEPSTIARLAARRYEICECMPALSPA